MRRKPVWKFRCCAKAADPSPKDSEVGASSGALPAFLQFNTLAILACCKHVPYWHTVSTSMKRTWKLFNNPALAWHTARSQTQNSDMGARLLRSLSTKEVR